MPYLVGVPVDSSGHDVLVFEVDADALSDELVQASVDPAKAADRLRQTLEESVEKIKPALHKVVQMLNDLSPKETEIEFGLSIGGEVGVFFAKGTGNANFTIRMTWK
jgi:hypothetical protein